MVKILFEKKTGLGEGGGLPRHVHWKKEKKKTSWGVTNGGEAEA